jgi:hypothetical protein
MKNINELPIDIHYHIMSYLDDNPIIYKKLYSKKLQKYIDIYNSIILDCDKSYVISGPSSYTRNKEIDHKIHHFSNYLYLSKYKLLADYNSKPLPCTNIMFLRQTMNSLNIFIYEIIKIFMNKNTLQKFYPGEIKDIIITIKNSSNNEYYKKINQDLTININSFS